MLTSTAPPFLLCCSFLLYCSIVAVSSSFVFSSFAAFSSTEPLLQLSPLLNLYCSFLLYCTSAVASSFAIALLQLPPLLQLILLLQHCYSFFYYCGFLLYYSRRHHSRNNSNSNNSSSDLFLPYSQGLWLVNHSLHRSKIGIRNRSTICGGMIEDKIFPTIWENLNENTQYLSWSYINREYLNILICPNLQANSNNLKIPKPDNYTVLGIAIVP